MRDAPCGEGCGPEPWPSAEFPFSPPGRGLFIELFKVVVEEVGVPCADAPGELVLPTSVAFELPADGEAVPEVPSFLFLDLLFSRLALES